MGKIFAVVALLVGQSVFASEVIVSYQCRAGDVRYYEDDGRLHSGHAAFMVEASTIEDSIEAAR